MVIEKFLALSMIALGLAASAAEASRPVPARVDNPRGGRRRVRWLRQHLNTRGPRTPQPNAPRD